MDCFSRDMGPVVRVARPENPNEIDEFVNPLYTELDEIGSFQSYCIGHFEQEWVDGLGQMIAEGRVPLTEAPRVEDPTELRHMDSGYIQRMEFSRLDRKHFYADAIIPVEITVSNQCGGTARLWKKKQWYRLRNIIEVQPGGYSISECGVSIYRKDEANPGLPLSEYLIPVLDEAGIEEEADQILMQYYPEALLSEPVDGRLLAERMGLRVRVFPIPDMNIMGKSIFHDSVLKGKGQFADWKLDVYPGDIIVNRRYKGPSHREQLSSIVIHECCHHYEHDLFVWAQSLYNADILGIDCPVVRGKYPSKGKSPVFWAERQARQITYRIKMNKMVTKAKAEEYLRLYKKQNPEGSVGEQYETTIRRLARFFEVSEQCARNRMVEIGFPETQGVLNFVDRKYIPPFSYPADVLTRNQTFLIGAKNAVKLFAQNEKFRELISSGAYIYVEGRFCVNKAEYVRRGEDGKPCLTEYARLHTEVCCLRFDREGSVENPEYHWGELHMEAGGVKQFTRNGQVIYCPQNAAEPGLCDPNAFRTELEWSVAIRKLISGKEFGDALKDLMDVRDISVEQMESASGISVSALKRLRAGQVATAEQIIAIAVALQLPPMVSGDLLEMCGIRLDHNSLKNSAYQMILMTQYKTGIEQVNTFLAACGCKKLKTAC